MVRAAAGAGDRVASDLRLTAVGLGIQGALPNQRLKLSGRGGRLIGKRSILIAAAAPRSLSETR